MSQPDMTRWGWTLGQEPDAWSGKDGHNAFLWADPSPYGESIEASPNDAVLVAVGDAA